MEAALSPEHLTRRQLFRGAAGLAALGGAGLGWSLLPRTVPDVKTTLAASVSGRTDPVRVFRSRPDLRPPAITLSGHGDSGFLFMGPSGATTSNGSQPGTMLVDDDGEPVWFSPVQTGQWVTNVRVQTYRDWPVLTWWEGTVVNGYGQGEAVIADSSYKEIARFKPAGGLDADLHEFLLTSEGTALLTTYPQTVNADLRAVGGPSNGQLFENVIQELDVATGKLLFEWNSLDHVPVSESHAPMSEPYDYLHPNSIAVASDGNLLVSARHTWTVYKLDRKTGAVIWRMGGKRSDFDVADNAQFSWQHHATPLTDTSMTLFDDGADGSLKTEPQSRGLLLNVDQTHRRVTMARSYTHPVALSSGGMGSIQRLPDGHILVGWGSQPYATEFSADGELIADAKLPAGLNSYRAFRYEWRGLPSDAPAVALTRNASNGSGTVYVSWNGATHAHLWQVHAGISRQDLRPVGIARRRGFETAIPIRAGTGYVAVSALDRAGNRLATSGAVRI